MAVQSNHDQAEAQNITALSAGGIAEAAQGANLGGIAENPAAPANPAPSNEGGTSWGGTNAGNPADSGGTGSPTDLGGIADSPTDSGVAGNSGSAGDANPAATPAPYELTAPEGFDVPAENLKGFSNLCNQIGISKEQAEKVLGWHKARHEENIAHAAREEAQTLQNWEREILADPEFGGSHWRGTLADARRALDRFDADGSLREFLRETRFQHHPQVIRVVARVGRALGEHGFVGMPGAQRGDSELARLKRQYPSEFRN